MIALAFPRNIASICNKEGWNGLGIDRFSGRMAAELSQFGNIVI